MNVSFRNYQRRINNLERNHIISKKQIQIPRAKLMELTHNQQVIGFGRTKWTLSNNTSIDMPIPGIYQIYWKNTAHTYQLIDYQEDTEEFIFAIFDTGQIFRTFLGIQVDRVNQHQSKRREWYERVLKILSGPGDFLLNASTPKDRSDYLAPLIAHFVTRA